VWVFHKRLLRFQGPRMRKKSLTKTLWKKSFRAAERAMIAAANRRNDCCALCGSTNTLQMDHSIVSRKHLSTFFEIQQTVLLCRNCHCSKSFDNHGLAYQVAEIVKKREGSYFIHWIISKSREVRKWTISELENLKAYFDKLYL